MKLLENALNAITGSMSNWMTDDKETGPATVKGKAIQDLAHKFYFDNFAGKETIYLFTVAIGVLIGILAKNLMGMGAPDVPDGPVN